jgi:hypothetical protein
MKSGSIASGWKRFAATTISATETMPPSAHPTSELALFTPRSSSPQPSSTAPDE